MISLSYPVKSKVSKLATAASGNPDSPSDADVEPARRYPRRNLPPTNYAALESPNEDDFICKCHFPDLIKSRGLEIKTTLSPISWHIYYKVWKKIINSWRPDPKKTSSLE